MEAQDVSALYRSNLQRSCITDFIVEGWGDLTMDFLGVTHSVMHETTRAILDGLVKDVTDKTHLNDSLKMTSVLAEINQSYAVANFPFSSEDSR